MSFNPRKQFPPTPISILSIEPTMLENYEGKFIAQRKFNGARTLIEFTPSKIKIWNRNEKSNSFIPSPEMLDHLQRWHQCLGMRSRHVIDGEILLFDDKDIKDVFVVFDILQLNDEYLTNTKYITRYCHLYDNLMGEPHEMETVSGHQLAMEFTQHLWLAENFYANFQNEYNRHINLDKIDGLILKDPYGELTADPIQNKSWMIRCVKNTKNKISAEIYSA